MNYTQEEIGSYSTGDVFYLRGKRYRLLKKTSTVVSLQRYYWFDAVADWIGRQLGSVSE